MGMFINSFIRHAQIVKMANLAQLVNVIAPIFTSKDGLYLQTIYFPLAEYAKQKGNQSLNVLVQSPEYKPDAGRALGYLDVSATYDLKSKQIVLNVLNRSEKVDITSRIDNVSGKLSNSIDVWELNNPDLKAAHTFGDDAKVRPATRKSNVALNENGFEYTFPKHSLTILKLKVN